MVETTSLLRASIGSRPAAERVAARARREVLGYAAFLQGRGSPDLAGFDALPLTDKAEYLLTRPYRDLLAGDFADTFAVIRSAGTGGNAFHWPQLKSDYAKWSFQLRFLLEAAFAIKDRRTLVIIGLSLGSWIGGDMFSWALKDVAVATPYLFTVFAPGNLHDEIIEAIGKFAPLYDQILLVCCPSAIGHILRRAEEDHRPLPLDKLRFLVLGEPFAEPLRLDLAARAGRTEDAVMLSVYGSADTGILGFESPATAALRRICHEDPRIAERLGIEGVTPHFFHLAEPDTYLEVINGELCVTKWQGIPLVRYDLHDLARLYDWTEVLAALMPLGAESPPLARNQAALQKSLPILPSPGLIAISGRADRCLVLCGTKLSEMMLGEALQSEPLARRLTGAYQARVVIEEGRQRLNLVLETRLPEPPDADAVYSLLIAALGRAQPEFLEDWRNIYARWDADPGQRILKIDFVAWPDLSQADALRIKQKGIVE